MEKKKRGSFTGEIGFVLAAAGSAVGLGNLWRFPYLAAQYGGGIFILVYIISQNLFLSTPGRKKTPFFQEICIKGSNSFFKLPFDFIPLQVTLSKNKEME